MSLQNFAAQKISKLLNSKRFSFAKTITILKPGETEAAEFKALNQKIGSSIDPDTGMLIVEQRASVAVCLQDLIDKGFSQVPTVKHRETEKPYIVTMKDNREIEKKYILSQTLPDETLDLVVLILQRYKND